MISVRLVHLGEQRAKPFCVGTYHMPCAYLNPQVMLIHAALAAQHLQEFAQGQEHIFAGDFNFEPRSLPYELYTKNSIEPNTIEHIKNDDWSPKLKVLLQSAYAIHSEEPEVTNYASTEGKPCFCGTLDYIFMSPGFKCISTEELPTLAYLKGRCDSLPNATEPSDHLLIGATLLTQ
jgi:mRNA deadenylase 3'-5' endonuclease subunit Ccr4